MDEKGEMKQKMMEYLFKSYQNVETQERVHKKVRKKVLKRKFLKIERLGDSISAISDSVTSF